MPRPSREERQIQRHTAQALKGVDKQGRTRGSSNVAETLKRLEAKQPGAVQRLMADSKKNIPPKSVSGQKIYSGSWRGFEAAFAKEWWASQRKPWTCCICHKPILQGASGRDAPTIEHRKPWAIIKLGIAMEQVCCNGSHWNVALTKEVRDVLQDTRNLAPAHQGCNSRKNGPKDTDSIAPQRIGDCHGADCRIQKGK